MKKSKTEPSSCNYQHCWKRKFESHCSACRYHNKTR